ncbi:MauE/DoxX family redox-associated membrane protein [Pseudodesulfovibrio pelocollis]|uniref:MauE/DoxX family redox-associated membrane protein n=1 Tax=Pseudodesulfovibrio pelocollis TaxID=3051432 RepID=UPI00255B0768|nr:MauE/DoxX family redox-associated membrane protein [Pseudodesulfovibrio sp. SB368]
MIELLRRILTHPWLALAFRLYIGGLFVYAAMYKINYAAEFSETIASYRLVPYWAVNALAVFMPWTEIVCGALLILGVRVRSAAAVIAALLAVFTVAIFVNLLWDAPISCGCFKTIEDPISWWTVLRDLAWIAMTLHVFRYDSVLQADRLFLGKLGRIES